jgi:hypothetical protein
MGGRVKSERKARAARFNGLKSGKYAKNPDTVKAILPSDTARAAGVTVPDMVLRLKQNFAFFGSTDRSEFLRGVEVLLARSLAQILGKEKRGRDTSKDYQALTMTVLELYDRQYGKVQYNRNVTDITHHNAGDAELLQRIVRVLRAEGHEELIAKVMAEAQIGAKVDAPTVR